ncbi:MAG: hypothetical protein LQ340_003147 [Diploschistes diacapsis]|nr:MAG: hypothetical protein LQ340_003147 [Diploschistes diacapsis]
MLPKKDNSEPIHNPHPNEHAGYMAGSQRSPSVKEQWREEEYRYYRDSRTHDSGRRRSRSPVTWRRRESGEHEYLNDTAEAGLRSKRHQEYHYDESNRNRRYSYRGLQEVNRKPRQPDETSFDKRPRPRRGSSIRSNRHRSISPDVRDYDRIQSVNRHAPRVAPIIIHPRAITNNSTISIIIIKKNHKIRTTITAAATIIIDDGRDHLQNLKTILESSRAGPRIQQISTIVTTKTCIIDDVKSEQEGLQRGSSARAQEIAVIHPQHLKKNHQSPLGALQGRRSELFAICGKETRQETF